MFKDLLFYFIKDKNYALFNLFIDNNLHIYIFWGFLLISFVLGIILLSIKHTVYKASFKRGWYLFWYVSLSILISTLFALYKLKAFNILEQEWPVVITNFLLIWFITLMLAYLFILLFTKILKKYFFFNSYRSLY